MAAKRADYFAAGTRVVRDVDPAAETVAVYRTDAPMQAVVNVQGDVLEAEPAMPDWRMAVAEMFM
jgi:Uma2 family endonuclease